MDWPEDWWRELGYREKLFGDERLWVCPADSQYVEDPDVHQEFHEKLIGLLVPAPLAVPPRADFVWARAAGGPSRGSVRVHEIKAVDGVRYAVIDEDGRRMPAADLVPERDRLDETIYDLISRANNGDL